MFFRKNRKPRQRYYLLPGQGGRNYFLKQRRFIIWAFVVALVFGAILSAVMWWMSRPKL